MMFETIILHGLKNVFYDYHNRLAFYINESDFTYKTLEMIITGIRLELKKIPEDQKIIGLVVNDDIYTYAGILALWFEGKAYVPLHPKQPLLRNMEIVNQVETQFILDSSEQSLFDNINVIGTSKIKGVDGNLEIVPCFDDELCYILFTSGSTGIPKGVQITRKNIASFVEAFEKTGINLNENDKCLQSFDLTFDVSVQSFLIPLLHGASVFTIPHEQIKYSYAYGLLEDHQLTFGAFAPSMIKLLKPYFDEISLDHFKNCILTAEASPTDLILAWKECLPNAHIHNYYGPTEATIYCTYQKIDFDRKIKDANGLLGIGKPFPGITIKIVDENFKELQHGEKGELLVAGPQLTPGYWKNPEKNQEVFIELEGRTFYKTGDLCILDEDHELLYFGRKDYQVKIQGYRIELGEIEYHARHYRNIHFAFAFVEKNNNNIEEICLCVEGINIDLKDLENHLKQRIPYYMIPSHYSQLDHFPINHSGKVDRIKIKEMIKQ